jgi:hypothetical protein
MRKVPDFDELVGRDLPADERARLHRVHELLVQADAPPELGPEFDAVPWPDEALGPLSGRRKKRSGQRRLLLAAAIATAVVIGIFLGQAANSSSFDAERTVRLQGTALAQNATGTLRVGKQNSDGNWPMELHVTNLEQLPNGGYYDLYLTRGGKPLVLCVTFNADGDTVVRFVAAYRLDRFDKNGWVVTRQPAGHHEPDQIVLTPSV